MKFSASGITTFRFSAIKNSMIVFGGNCAFASGASSERTQMTRFFLPGLAGQQVDRARREHEVANAVGLEKEVAHLEAEVPHAGGASRLPKLFFGIARGVPAGQSRGVPCRATPSFTSS